MRLLPTLALACLFSVASPHAQTAATGLEGAWAGTLEAGPMKIHIVFHIVGTLPALTATMDSPDQNAHGLPTSSVTLDGNLLTIVADKIGVRYIGTLNEAHTSIDGTFTQGGHDLNLTLTPLLSPASLEPARPQTPKPPFPYRVEEVTFPNAKANLALAGTLTLPKASGRVPAVILIAGSGPHDRDETIFGHKPFTVLADALTRRGIAVLRYDKRGIGGSTGSFRTATMQDFAADAEAALGFLHTRTDIDPQRIALLGHSEGGAIAPLVAAHHPHEVNAVVLLAGPGVNGVETIVSQTHAIALASGIPADAANKNADIERRLLELARKPLDPAAKRTALTEELTRQGIPEKQIASSIDELTSPWFQSFLAYDPAAALRQVRCPLLALNGAKDTQVVAAQNLPAIHAADPHAEVEELPGLNHLFQTASTGAPSEYSTLSETIAPTVLDKISLWLLAQPPILR